MLDGPYPHEDREITLTTTVEWYSHQPVHRGNPNHQRPRHHHRNNRQVPLVPPGHQQHRHLGRKTRPLVGQSREKNHERPTVTPTQNTSLDHRGHRRRHGDSGFPAWVPGIQHQGECRGRGSSAISSICHPTIYRQPVWEPTVRRYTIPGTNTD